MKKMIALVLCLAMALCLCACGGTSIESYDDDNVEAADAAETDAAEADGTDAAETANAELAAPSYDLYPGDTVIGAVNGEDVTWMEYYYWLNYYTLYVNQLAASYGVALSSWDACELSSTMTNAQVVDENAKISVIQHHVIQTKAQELGITLGEEEQAMVTQVFELNADSASGDGDGVCTAEEAAAFELYLAEQYVDKAFFDYLNEISLLSEALFTHLYGEEGADCPEDEVLAYVEDNGILSAKHILLLTKDMTTGEDLSEEEIAAKLATAEDLLAQLQAETDLEAMVALFDELTAQYTEDTGYVNYPEGYIFGEGEMVSEFEDAVKELDPDYGLSDIVESSYGYHIILRQPIAAESSVGVDANGNTVTVRAAVASNLFNADLTAWVDEADASWEDSIADGAVFG